MAPNFDSEWGTSTNAQYVQQSQHYWQKREELSRQMEKFKNLTNRYKDEEENKNNLKKGKHMKSDYFYSNGDCRAHHEEDCEECMNDYREEKNEQSSRSLALVASSLANERESSVEAEDTQLRAKRDLSRKVRFIKKSLGKTDEQIKKMKVKDLSKELLKAQDEITVGGMEELLEEDTKDSGGFIKGILKFFLKGGRK